MARAWCLTSFNTEVYDSKNSNLADAYVKADETRMDRIRFMVFQVEKCPETGRYHIQGYIKFFKNQTLKMIKKILGDEKAHLEIARNEAALKNYSMKEESRVEGPWIYGKDTVKGERTDIANYKKMIEEGKKIEEIADADPNTYIKYSRGIKEYMMLKKKKYMRDVSVIVHYGKAGCGKTHKVWEDEGIDNVYRVTPPNQKNAIWFDGYKGEQIILLDDFTGDWCTVSYLLNLIDKYPLNVQIKGGMVMAEWTKVYITSNCHPMDWFDFIEDEQKVAVMRRITRVTNYEVACNTRATKKISLKKKPIEDIDMLGVMGKLAE